jgi:hypothetical protein
MSGQEGIHVRNGRWEEKTDVFLLGSLSECTFHIRNDSQQKTPVSAGNKN